MEKREEGKGSQLKILGFVGSLRKGSFNKALMRLAQEVVPAGARLDVFDLEGIPAFNQDLEARPPDKIREFKEKIRGADAILIATPEYNYSVPGVLKNAIDWVSRPYGDNALEGKPVAIMGASIGMLGTGRAQYHLRQSFVFLNMFPLNRPEIMVPFVEKKVDQEGRIIDETTRRLVRELLDALIAWTRKLQGA